MSTLLPLACCIDKPEPCQNEGEYIIYIKNKGYSLCDQYFKLFKKIGQIRLKDYGMEAKYNK